MIVQLQSPDFWDILIIGGGATGLGTAVDAASRGYRTLLLEQHDFAKGTSSRSTKLVHGGVRYLQQGNIRLVREALYERGLLLQNAPHLVHKKAFIIPAYSWWQAPFYTIGLKIYDALAGKKSFGSSRYLSRSATLEAIPNLKKQGLKAGVLYYDGQFDDARLAINLAQTAARQGATLINYMQVAGLLKNEAQRLTGVQAMDKETGQSYTLHAKVVINATGVFADDILQMDNANAKASISPSQGVHLVLDKHFLQGDAALLIPKTADGRVLFAVPWHNKVVIGTTDTPVAKESLEPRALEEEIQFILRTAGDYLANTPKRADVRSVFAGLRPLAAPQEGKKTKDISRNHKVIVSSSGLISTIGGKWTTYRKMAADTIDQAIITGKLSPATCNTSQLPIHGASDTIVNDELGYYGSDRLFILDLITKDPSLGKQVHPALPMIKAEIIWAAREEMARTVEDVLARRTRALLLNARASIEIAPEVARLLAAELGKDEDWQREQVAAYTALANGYLLSE